MERKSEGIRQSSDDMTETKEFSTHGLKGVSVYRRVVVDGAVAWEFDVCLTAKRNGCSFKERVAESLL